MNDLLNKTQIRDLANAYNSGRDMRFKITQKQVGNGIGTILASIGIPILLDAIRGKGVGGSAVRIGVPPSKGDSALRMGMPPNPPPFIGTCGKGKKKTLKKLGQKKLVFKKTVPMSNFDLLEWCKYLGIPIKDVLSRDVTVPHNHKLAIIIYNLEPSYMSGSHWVATYVRDGVINYFDSFGMPPFQKIVDYAKMKNLTLLHQNMQIQNLYTSICGYFCLYCLNEMNKGTDYWDLLHVFRDTKYNEKFIENYFKNI